MTVWVVDDDAGVRSVLQTVLERQTSVNVVRAFPDAESALTALRTTQDPPTVILMDLQMPGMGGLAATQRLSDTPDSPPVVVLTHLSDDASVFAALRAGAVGYVTKDAPARRLLEALDAAQRGEASLDAGLARRVVDEFRRLAQRADRQHTLFETLSRREFEILELVVEGLGNRAIAERLVLAERTVKNHVAAILVKLHVNNRREAAQIGRDHGLGGSR